MEAGDDRQEPESTTRPATDRGETKPRGESAQTAKGSERRPKYAVEPAPRLVSSNDVVELDSDDRKTQRVSAEHFRSMRRAAAVRDAAGTIKRPGEIGAATLAHEELASSHLIAEALAEIKAGAPLDTDRERLDTYETPPLRADGEPDDASIEDEPSPGELAIARIKPISMPVGAAKVSAKAVADAAVSEAAAKERSAPSTIPMTTEQLTEIGAIRPRHPIKMAPLTKPPDLAPADDEVIALEAKKPAREVPRSDVGLLIVAGVLVLGVIATIAILLA